MRSPRRTASRGFATPRRIRLTLAVLALVTAACAGSATTPSERLDEGPDPERRGPQGRVAQFIVECDLSHLAYDDPIVLPGQPGASHLHQFFGNWDVTARPDYGSVLGAETSCKQRLDTASYWAPALLDAAGKRVPDEGLTAYYRPGSGIDPEDVVAYPEGLMLIGGDSEATEPQPTDIVSWSCGTGPARDTEPQQCPAGSTLRMLVKFPDCWDGKRLTDIGEEPHAAYSDGGCPDGFPVAVPQLLVAIDYPPVDPDGLSLASGSILSGHADFWNVWDQEKLERETRQCINRDLVCGVSS